MGGIYTLFGPPTVSGSSAEVQLRVLPQDVFAKLRDPQRCRIDGRGAGEKETSVSLFSTQTFRFVSFWFVLFCCVLFCPVRFCSVLFRVRQKTGENKNVLFCFVWENNSVLFRFQHDAGNRRQRRDKRKKTKFSYIHINAKNKNKKKHGRMDSISIRGDIAPEWIPYQFCFFGSPGS